MTEILATAFAIVLTIFVAILCGWIVVQFNKFRPQSFHGFGAYDPLIVAGLWAFAGLAAISVFRMFARSTSTESVWACVWLGTAISGLLAAMYVPGFSYVMLTVGIVPAILSLFPHDKAKMSVVAIAVACVFSIPLAYQFGVALGPSMAPALSALYVLFLVPLFPLLAGPVSNKSAVMT